MGPAGCPEDTAWVSESAKAVFDTSKGDNAGANEALHNMNPLTAISRDATALKDPNSMTSQVVHTGPHRYGSGPDGDGWSVATMFLVKPDAGTSRVALSPGVTPALTRHG